MRDLAERLLSACYVDEQSGCWVSTLHVLRSGYANIRLDRETRMGVHRLAYVLWVGPIPGGAQIDHVAARGCTHRACFNPDHLEAVTCQENLLRSAITLAAANAAKTHCTRGHALAGQNLYVTRDGRRNCKACKTLSKARRRAATWQA